MNNIQKSFKSKARCGLRMAVGGVIADPTDQQRTPDSDLDRLTAQSNMSAAMAGLSNTERYQLANPTNAPYKANSMMGGTSAEASMLRQRSGILASLRDRLAEQQQPTLPSLRFADGGIINTLRNRGVVIDAAVDSAVGGGAPAPAAAPVAAAPALPSQAGDYAAQAAALEAEQLAAARAAAAPKPKQGLMSRLGFAQGGVVRLQGPGTGTSDDIPLTLNTGGEGMNINVSNGEGLAVLPAKTMQHPEAVEAVNDIIETTNGKPPRGLKAGASYADGMFDKVRAGVSGAANWVADKVAPAAAEAPVTPAAPAGGAAPVAEAPATPISAKTQAALRANMADQSLYGRTVEAVGNAKQSLERGAARVAASPYARELGRAATIVAAAGPAIENSLGENRIKPVGEQSLAKDFAAGVFNSVDTGMKFVDNMASPITHGLNYAVKTFGGPENYFNDRAMSNAYRRGLVEGYPEFTAPTTQNGEKVKIAGASSAPAQSAAIEPGAQERTFGASGAAPAPTPAAAADAQPPANDIQVRSIRGANGKMQPEFYGKNVTQTYTGADGKPTTNWYETQAYKDSQVQAAKDKELLKTYEKWGLEGDLKSNNPAYQARGLARQKAFDENSRTEAAREVAAANRDLQRQELDIRREDLGLRRAQEERAIAAASRQAQLAAAEEGRKADEATSKKQDNYHKYLESVLTMPLTDSNGNVTNAPDARAIAEFTSKADATVAAMEEATRGTAEHSRWVDPTTKKPKSSADLDDTQKSWVINRYKAYQRIKQAQKGWSTLGYADKFDTNDLSLLDGAEEGDYISFPKLKAKLGFVPRIQKKDLAYSDGPIGLTDLQLGKTPYDALTNNILGR